MARDIINMKCTTNGCNKFYNLEIIEDPTQEKRWQLIAHYGAIGFSGKREIKGVFFGKSSAIANRDKWVRQKTARGYIIIPNEVKEERKKPDHRFPKFLSRFDKV